MASALYVPHFCGIAVRIKPAFTLSYRCFLHPLLHISTLVPRSHCCSRPELLCASSVISDILLAGICSNLHP